MAGFLRTMTALNGNEHNVFFRFPPLSFFLLFIRFKCFFGFLVQKNILWPMYLGRCREPN